MYSVNVSCYHEYVFDSIWYFLETQRIIAYLSTLVSLDPAMDFYILQEITTVTQCGINMVNFMETFQAS